MKEQAQRPTSQSSFFPLATDHQVSLSSGACSMSYFLSVSFGSLCVPNMSERALNMAYCNVIEMTIRQSEITEIPVVVGDLFRGIN